MSPTPPIPEYEPGAGATVIAAIDERLRAGELQAARETATRALRAQHKAQDDPARAPLLLRMAWSELALSAPGGAYRAAMEAAGLFRAADDAGQEVLALCAAAMAASQWGRTVQALETAMLAGQLALERPPGAAIVQAQHSLALACGAAQCFSRARQAHDAAVQAARDARLDTALAELHAARVLNELGRLVVERGDGGAEPDLAPLRAALRLLQGAPATQPPLPLMPGQGPALAAALPLLTQIAQCWCTEDASTSPATAPPAGSGVPAWVDALGAWLMAERSLRGGDPRHAAAHAGRMVAAAEAASHRPLLRLAHELAGHLHEQAGQPAEALRQQRLVARLEREQRLHDLEGRDAVARSHLRLRAEERTSRALATQSQEFERMAFEDALTGIANSRRFQQCLAQWSAECEAAGETLCAAVIDVDRFKAVNDGFGHVVGDAVLRAIAAILVEHVRSVDLPARLGGDEFVILFRNADAAVARQVCDRIEHSVLNHPWGQLAAGVAVSISVGVAQALPGDTVEALIGRGDLAMFERKRSRHLPAAVPALVVPAPPQRPVPPLLLDRLAALVRRARQVVVFHGPGPLGGAAWSVAERERYGRAEGRIHHAPAFAEFWRERAAAAGAAQPTLEHRLLARLAALKPTTTFVTQRVDGLLAAAGAGHVIELCGSLREDPAAVLLPGDPANARLAAGAELAVKRADVVLVVDADPLAFPGPSLLDKARFRGVAVVLLGSAFAPGGAFANIAIQAPAHDVLAALLERLGTEGDPRVPARGLTDAGYDALCFLSGHGTDHAGRTLAQTLAWTDREIERQFDSTQWQFPLPTASPVCPEAPVPTRGDFAALAADEGAKAGMRGAFHRMLRFYGFEWRDGHVAKADGWRARFDVWAVAPGHNDLRLSRMLGALALCGLQDESLALLRALEVHVPPVRQHGLAKALAFWRHAAGQGALASDEPRAPQASWRQ